MDTTNTPADKVLNLIKARYSDHMGKSLSIDYILTKQQYITIVGDLLKLFPSVQATYNAGANEDKVHLVIGYV